MAATGFHAAQIVPFVDQQISEKFNHDATKLGTYYRELDKKYRKSGKYKFVDPPSEKPKVAKSKDGEAAD